MIVGLISNTEFYSLLPLPLTSTWPHLNSISAATVGNGGDWSTQTFRLGTNNVLVPQNVLAVVFKKQEISQQVLLLMSAEATRMQDLASEFSKNFPGVIPQTTTARGCDPSRTHPSPASGRAWGCKHPSVGTKTLVPLYFSVVVAPLLNIDVGLEEGEY